MSILAVAGCGMVRKKHEELVQLSVKLPKQLVVALRRLAEEQGRKLQVVTAAVVAAGLAPQEKSK
jgi:hypothetical protein